MASSQSVRSSSGSRRDVSPAASRPIQRTSSYGRPQCILNLTSSCTSCSGRRPGQPLAVAGRHPSRHRGGGRVVGRRRSALNSGETRTRVAGISSLQAFGAVRARTRKGTIHRKEGSGRDGRGACAPCRLCRATPRSPPRTALPAGRRRAPPCAGPAAPATAPHVRSHAPHQVHSQTPLGQVRRRVRWRQGCWPRLA